MDNENETLVEFRQVSRMKICLFFSGVYIRQFVSARVTVIPAMECENSTGRAVANMVVSGPGALLRISHKL